MKNFLTVIFSSLYLFGQQSVDVFPDGVYIQERNDFHGTGILKINPDLSFEHFLPPTLPKGFDLKNLIVGIRPKIRFDNYWISDREKIYRRPLDAEPGQEWELVKLPDGIEQFSDFEVISDKEAIICGCVYKPFDKNVMLIHFIFNYKTGALTIPIDSLDLRSIPPDLDEFRRSCARIRIFNSYMCRLDSRIIIVGKYSGLVTVLDLNDDGKFVRSRKFKIIPENELPSDHIDAVNNGPAIAWIGPLSGDDVLICCRMWVMPDKNPSKPVITYCFRTFNLKTGKVTFEGSIYRDRKAENYLTLFEENGELSSVRDILDKRLKQIEQTKKSKLNSDVPVNEDNKGQ